MNILRLSYSGLRHNRIGNLFNVMILAFGIAIIITLLHLGEQVRQRFENDLAGIDLVVGAKGSPIQLILSSVFHIDAPIGNIPLAETKKLEKNPLIKFSIPVALGDNYQGFRIVGTTADYPGHYGAKLAEGHYWQGEMQAVAGSEVARIAGLQVGKKFTGAHGLEEGGEEHGESSYEVTGILAPTGTVLDRLVLTSVESVWHIHEHHHHESSHDRNRDSDDHDHDHDRGGKEITALLIGYKSPLAAASLPRTVNQSSSMQAASPAFEMARLIRMLGIGGDVVQVFGGALICIAASGFFMTLFNAVKDRKYDLALLRILGATRSKVFAFVMAEGMMLGAAGTVLGIALGHVFSYGVRVWIESSRHMSLASVGVHPYEAVAALAAIAISVLASLIPAFMAYRVKVAETISRGQ